MIILYTYNYPISIKTSEDLHVVCLSILNEISAFKRGCIGGQVTVLKAENCVLMTDGNPTCTDRAAVTNTAFGEDMDL